MIIINDNDLGVLKVLGYSYASVVHTQADYVIYYAITVRRIKIMINDNNLGAKSAWIQLCLCGAHSNWLCYLLYNYCEEDMIIDND